MAFPRLRNRSAFAIIFGVAILEFQRNISVKLELSASADEVTVKLIGRIDCQWIPMGEIDGHSAIEVGSRIPAGAVQQIRGVSRKLSRPPTFHTLSSSTFELTVPRSRSQLCSLSSWIQGSEYAASADGAAARRQEGFHAPKARVRAPDQVADSMPGFSP